MVVYDFSNLNLQQKGNDNFFYCDNGGDCYSCDIVAMTSGGTMEDVMYN